MSRSKFPRPNSTDYADDADIIRTAQEVTGTITQIAIKLQPLFNSGKFRGPRKFEEYGFPFSKATARKLVAISGDQRITENLERLPRDWTVLNEAALMSNACFEQALETGILRPGAKRAEVKVFRNQFNQRRPDEAQERAIPHRHRTSGARGCSRS